MVSQSQGIRDVTIFLPRRLIPSRALPGVTDHRNSKSTDQLPTRFPFPDVGTKGYDGYHSRSFVTSRPKGSVPMKVDSVPQTGPHWIFISQIQNPFHRSMPTPHLAEGASERPISCRPETSQCPLPRCS